MKRFFPLYKFKFFIHPHNGILRAVKLTVLMCIITVTRLYAIAAVDLSQLKTQKPIQAVNSKNDKVLAFVVQGRVTDDKNLTVPGVTVKIKGSQVATSTDAGGQYKITVSDETSVLVFSSIGYITQEMTVGKNKVINIILQQKQSDLNEIVVIGYGTIKKRDLTGAVGQVAMSDLTKAPVMSLADALGGRVAGLQVSTSDGQPGSPINITVRGANSITQDNSPLYVVDGFPIEGFNLNTFNPQDIESIEILKDASSTAIYGARGANGVIIITTKKGLVGKAQTTFTTTQSWTSNIKTMQLMDSYQFLKYQIDRDPAPGSAATPTPTYSFLTVPNKQVSDYVNYPTANIQEPFFKTGSLRNYSLAIRGGTKQTQYSVSGSVDNVEGTIIATSFNRYQGRITLDQQLSDKIKVGINANYAYLKQAGNAVGASTNLGTTNVLYSVWGYNPLTEITDDFIDPTTNTSADYKVNPIINQSNMVRNVNTGNSNVNAYLTYNILPGLVLKVTGGFNNNVVDNQNFNNSNTLSGSPLTIAGLANGINGNIITSKVNNWLNENTLTWNKVFNYVHTVNVLGGFTMQGNTSSSYGFGAKNLANEELGVSGLDEGILNPIQTKAASSLWNGASFLGKIDYNYKSLYYLTLSYRADGSSKFAPQNHWGYFPSGALAWRFSGENFLKEIKWISDGKLRVSYGKTGNNRVGDFPYLSSTAVASYNSYGFNNAFVPSIIPLTVANPDLKWETTDQYDGGLDLSLLNGRISLTADVYRKITKDLLLNASLPSSTGYSTAFKNIGGVQNQGLELTLSTVNLATTKFKWTSNFNITFNQSKVLGLTDGQQSLLSSVQWDSSWSSIPAYISQVGKPLGLLYGFIADGVYQYNDFNRTSTGTYILKDNVSTNGNVRTSIQPGDIKYKDINGDGIVNSSDYTVIGQSLPIHTGGFGNNLNYKNFDLNIFFQWSYGNNIQDANQMIFEGNIQNRAYLNQFASYIDRWSPTNQNSSNPRAGFNGYFGGGYSSRTVQDGSYLRLKTVSLGYNIPKSLLKRINVTSLRIYASAQNLYTWTKYTGLDPEVNSYNSVLTGGFDYSNYPRARTIAFGINLTL